MKLRSVYCTMLAIGFCATWSITEAATWTVIRVGDIDGFGFNGTDAPAPADGATAAPWNAAGPAGPFLAANGAVADTDGDGILEAGEYLPDVNRGRSTLTGGGDDWDNRTASEVANSYVSFDGTDTVDNGTTGSKWTDITLSTSYGNPGSTKDDFLGQFPDGSRAVPNEPFFMFDFSILKLENPDPFQVFFNVVFGDYDVFPAEIELTFRSGIKDNIPLSLQPSNQDGLVQAASSTLNFFDVFIDGGTTWDALLGVKLLAANEPYTAFDFVELSRIRIDSNPVPEPGTLILLGSGLIGIAGYGRRRRIA